MIRRRSNIELFRIIVMLLIVCHHYVVNSGLFALIKSNPYSLQSSFLALFGMWGKTGINCFVLITGYFMCLSRISTLKIIKLFLEIELYNFLIYLIFVISGYAPFSLKDFALALLPIKNVNLDFTSAFLLYYFFIPFINTLTEHLTKTKHGLLIILCLLVYSIGCHANIGFHIHINYLTWFIILHLIASYIRFYGVYKEMDSRLWGLLSLFSILVSCSTVILSLRTGQAPYRFVQDSNAPLALLSSICAFVYFKGLRIKDSLLINQIAAGTFGVLLIHANSDLMRNWLWRDTLKNISFFHNPYIHAFLSVLVVFIVCNCIDYLRRRFLERPIISAIENKARPYFSQFKKWTNELT